MPSERLETACALIPTLQKHITEWDFLPSGWVTIKMLQPHSNGQHFSAQSWRKPIMDWRSPTRKSETKVV